MKLQCDLRTFLVDHERACALGGTKIPWGWSQVAESGIRDADDARRLAAAGYDAILKRWVRPSFRSGRSQWEALLSLTGHPVGSR